MKKETEKEKKGREFVYFAHERGDGARQRVDAFHSLRRRAVRAVVSVLPI